MSEQNSTGSGGGVSVVGMLGVLFVGLKLAGVIDWSWWWVTLPFWGGLAFAGGLALIGVVLVAIASALGGKRR